MMKLTKYEHACFTVEKDEQILVVDPGVFSTDFMPPENVVGIVITHEHADHYDHEMIAEIIDKNPDALIIGHKAITTKIEAFPIKSVSAGETMTVGPFELQFFGGQHALIHESIPRVANLGILIDELLYYPGDSFTLPEMPVDVLAIPASAPWLKIGEAIDFLTAIHPRLAFPTHDAILSSNGKQINDNLLGMVAKQNSIEYVRLTKQLEV
jgi:L-ascorbate metabolism protein UlaG (beta-lactamase superfamily)